MEERDPLDIAVRVLADLLIGIALAILICIPFIGCDFKLPAPNPTPTPTPVSTPTPTPIPTPKACVIPDGPGATFLVPRPPADEAATKAINAAAWNVVSGLAPCDGPPVSRCTVFGPTSIEFRLSVVERIKSNGGCAGIQATSDEVCVLLADGKSCQGFHIYTDGRDAIHGTVGWAPGSARDTWHLALPGPQPTPVSTPTPTPLPCPPEEQICSTTTGGLHLKTVCQCPVSPCPTLGRIVLTVRQGARLLVDATPQTSDKAWCDANGFAGRNNCPMGAEGSESRPKCETLAGPYTWLVDGGDFFNNDNPLQIVVRSHAVGSKASVCGGNHVCASVALP
jgi:hypothetical protein